VEIPAPAPAPAPASCLLLLVLRPASCVLRPASCLLRPASCVLPPASCLLRPASCVLLLPLFRLVLERDPRLFLQHERTHEEIGFPAARHFDCHRQNAGDTPLQVEHVL
jgi:hypothetical protein